MSDAGSQGAQASEGSQARPPPAGADGMLEGVGGVFIWSNDARGLADWYTETFGVEFEHEGHPEKGPFAHTFWAIDPTNPNRRVDTVFSIFQAEDGVPTYEPDHAPDSIYAGRPYMVNLRVKSLDETIAALEAGGISIVKRDDDAYGSFAWIYDPEGRRIELYESRGGAIEGP